ncbi:hypothetical protein C8Q79DRAFT_647823 [Trametes meyenii]|nr:hypothetical protein C8Q79DRAFT_647823 [Trametes meyenii]
MATQQVTTTPVNFGQDIVHQPAAVAHGNEENIAPTAAQRALAGQNAVRDFENEWASLFRNTLRAHNGPLGPTAKAHPSPTNVVETEVPPSPFGGPYGPLRRTRIEGNDELVFGTF